MSKQEKARYQAVHQAVARAASVIRGNDQDDAFSIDLGKDMIMMRSEVHPRQLSLDGDLFPTFTCDEVRS